LVGRSTSVSGLLVPRAGRLINLETDGTCTHTVLVLAQAILRSTAHKKMNVATTQRRSGTRASPSRSLCWPRSWPAIPRHPSRLGSIGGQELVHAGLCAIKHSLTLSVDRVTSSLCWGSAFACPHRVNTRTCTCSSHASAMRIVWRISDCNHELHEIAGEKRGAPQATPSGCLQRRRTSRLLPTAGENHPQQCVQLTALLRRGLCVAHKLGVSKTWSPLSWPWPWQLRLEDLAPLDPAVT
jgi:hypothetical protein